MTARADAPAPDAKAAALLAKHRAYVGWQLGDGTFKTLRIKGSITDEKGKKTGEFTNLTAGLVYRETDTSLDRDGSSEQTGYTGNLFWHSNVNDFTTPIYGDYARFLASETVLREEGTTELPASFVKETTIDGKTADVVRVTLKNGDPIDCYVNPESGAYVRAVIDPDGSYQTTMNIVSYRDITPGKKTVGSYRYESDKSVFGIDSIEPNVAVSPDDFHPPSPTAFWSFGSGEPFPIKLTRSRILVDATINGVKGRFILDTGADGIYLDDQFADRAKVKVLPGTGEAETIEGSVPIRARTADTIALGDATLHNVIVHSRNFRSKYYWGLDAAEYDGLMGYDLFAAAVVKLDVYASKMAILDPTTDVSGTKGIALIVDLSDSIPAVPMTLNKTVQVNAALDTGNPGLVFMNEDRLKKNHVSMGFFGCASVHSLTLGPITYNEQAGCEWGFPLNTKDVLLGYDFLKHFDYVFDYPQGRMYMTPNKN